MQFKDLNIMPEILRALKNENYKIPTPIQEEAIPVVLSGRDLLGCAQTGTGKTAAFAIPTLQMLSGEETPRWEKRTIKALVVTPTRELAIQIYDSFNTYGQFTSLKTCVVYGGVSQKPQEENLKRGVDILVATPGRLLDLMDQKIVNIEKIRILVLDEADRMLDMGFIHDVKKIIARTPEKKQTLFFSATMPPDIAKLAAKILKNPEKIEITPAATTVEAIEQYLYFVDKGNKKDLLLHILKTKNPDSTLVFTRTKHGADRVVRQLSKSNVVAQAIHGDKSQGARQRALNDFKDKKLRVLVATDIAARGIDIDELACVVNYDLPDVPETYVHRIGRTGRAGLEGIAISFCDFDEKAQLADIEKLIGKKLIEVTDHPYPLQNNFPSVKATQSKRGGGKNADQAGAAQGIAAKKKEKKAAQGTVASEARPFGKISPSEECLSKKSQSTGARTPKKSQSSEAPLSKKTSSRGSRRRTETSISSAPSPHKTPAPAARSQAERPAQGGLSSDRPSAQGAQMSKPAPTSNRPAAQGAQMSKPATTLNRPAAQAAPTTRPAPTSNRPRPQAAPTSKPAPPPQPTPSPQKRRRNPFSGLLRKPGGGFR
ncbi:DEAD/DEAH box helicase [Enterocloster lavalensis]|uniref:DEAD/DEAH box helicase n=1 Tax=Enterocloster lavalensis TaxID=460384 RepID=UPI002F3EA430